MNMIAIDGNSLMYRAYYALPEMATKSGRPTGALYGFLSMLFKLAETTPDYLAVAFDVHAPTFRHEKYTAYKAGRKPTPPDLLTQMGLIHDILREMEIAIVESAGYEADDMLGAFAETCEKEGISLQLVTGDKDALQLVSATTSVLLTKKGLSETVAFTPETLRETYDLTPDGMRDLKALMGDSSDNIPGVAGVGEKTALKLLAQYGTLENILAHSAEIPGKLGERLREQADAARLSYWLGTINRDTPLPLTLKDCAFAPSNLRQAAGTLQKLELRSLVAKLPAETVDRGPRRGDYQSPAIADSRQAEIVSVTTIEQVCEVLGALPADAELAILLEPTLSFAVSETRAYRIAQGDSLFDVPIDLASFLRAVFGTRREPLPPVSFADFPPRGGGLLTYDAKRLMTACAGAGLPLPQIAFDAAVADYLLNANRPAANFSVIAEEWLGQAQPHAGQLFTLRDAMMAAIDERGLRGLYADMEGPLTRVLFDMEQAGFCVDERVLQDLGAEM
ncbi:MAG: hypothetical protein FWE69_08985, partial [Clostridiales bacterium]|nr:hypothetical protein [Clostridiales bacterium]